MSSRIICVLSLVLLANSVSADEVDYQFHNVTDVAAGTYDNGQGSLSFLYLAGDTNEGTGRRYVLKANAAESSQKFTLENCQKMALLARANPTRNGFSIHLRHNSGVSYFDSLSSTGAFSGAHVFTLPVAVYLPGRAGSPGAPTTQTPISFDCRIWTKP